jgi:hypothetical protein
LIVFISLVLMGGKFGLDTQIITDILSDPSSNGYLKAVNYWAKEKSPKIDFIVAGFPKCGTSTLVYTFEEHPETQMSATEYCDLGRDDRTDEEAMEHLEQMIQSEFNETKSGIKLGFKCPNAIRFIQNMKRIESQNPNAKVIIGVRHPVRYFESYYNYRVVALNTDRKHKGGEAPSPYDLIGDRTVSWRGVFTESARYEEALMQMGKVKLNDYEETFLREHDDLNLVPTSLQVFLYEVDQLADENEDRKKKMQTDMQQVLGLKKPIGNFGHRNVNAKKGTFDNSINICDEKFRELRNILVRRGEKTSIWIRDKFIESSEVFVGGDRDYFLELISGWGKDPC